MSGGQDRRSSKLTLSCRIELDFFASKADDAAAGASHLNHEWRVYHRELDCRPKYLRIGPKVVAGCMYKMRNSVWTCAAGACALLAAWRALDVVLELQEDKEHALLAFPLSVIFPVVLIAVLLALPPTESREGLLMRIGTIAHLLLIIALPPFALHLALGLPVVFLLVELFETRLAPRLRNWLARLVVA